LGEVCVADLPPVAGGEGPSPCRMRLENILLGSSRKTTLRACDQYKRSFALAEARVVFRIANFSARDARWCIRPRAELAEDCPSAIIA